MVRPCLFSRKIKANCQFLVSDSIELCGKSIALPLDEKLAFKVQSNLAEIGKPYISMTNEPISESVNFLQQ